MPGKPVACCYNLRPNKVIILDENEQIVKPDALSLSRDHSARSDSIRSDPDRVGRYDHGFTRVMFRSSFVVSKVSILKLLQSLIIQGGPKNLAPFFLYPLTLPNINRLSKLFYYQKHEKICNNTVAKDPTTPQVCRYTTL